jgi:phosphate transport system substrate-binding protein
MKRTFMVVAGMVGAAVALSGALVAIAGLADAQLFRTQIRIVGSSTVYPFTVAVAEQFAQSRQFRAPSVESTGTGAGIRSFCIGLGAQYPDIANASRRMTPAEFAACRQNGVTNIVELQIGFDGIVIAVRKGMPTIDLTREQIWRGLAREVPVNGQLVRNPHTHWNQIDPSLPRVAIAVIGPPETSGTRDSFVELVMQEGCRTVAEVRAVANPRRRNEVCSAIREDGRFIEAGENDALIVQRLAADQPGIMGIFGYSYLDQNRDRLDAVRIDGIEDNFATIASGRYPLSRPLYVYLKQAHIAIIPGLREFLVEYASERAMGDAGYLVSRGLVPMVPQDREQWRQRAQELRLLNLGS